MRLVPLATEKRRKVVAVPSLMVSPPGRLVASMVTPPASLMAMAVPPSGPVSVMVCPLRAGAKVMSAGPLAAAASVMACRSEPAPVSLVLVTV